MRNGRGRKEQSQYATQGQPKGALKGEEEEVRNGRGGKEQSPVTVRHSGATKGSFTRGMRRK